jgi:NRPS condensation-like uncharacterized protein
MNAVDQLPLSPFEELFLLRDHPDSPSSFLVRFELSESLDVGRLESSLEQVCQLHPLAATKVELDRGGQQWWAPCSTPIDVQWHKQPFEEVGYPTSWFDVKTQRPLRVLCFPRKDAGTTLVLHVHHVAFDGLGILQLFEDWLQLYRKKKPHPIYDKRKLTARCRPKVSFWKAIRLLPGQWKSVRATFRVMGREVIPLLPFSIDAGQRQSRNPSVETRILSTDATVNAKKIARTNGVSTNSLLAARLYITIDQWQQSNGHNPSGSHFRLVMPFNERGPADKDMSACNHCTVISFDRSRKEVRKAEALAKDIDREVRVIKRWRLSLNFWRALSLFRNLPGGLGKHASADRVTATTLFSNLGKLDRMFKFVSDEQSSVMDMEVVPTLHRGMPIAMVVYEFGGQIRISMQYDRRVLDQAQANEFADRYVEAITDPE